MDKKTIRDILDAVREQGWRIEETKKGWMVFPPMDGRLVATPVLMHKTPSDRRAWDNTVAALRRSGFVWKGR